MISHSNKLNMEEEQSSIHEKQDPTDEQGAAQQAGGTNTTTTTTSAVRSYECNFCKRGFTNAQALGGHMNIHRKDKAKLKKSSMASSDPSTPQPQHFPPSPKILRPPNMFQTHPGKWAFSSSKDHTADIRIANKSITHEVKKQPSLLLDDHQNPLAPPSSSAEGPPPELDLELRLGHNTDQPSSDQQKGTRNFF